MIRYINRPYGFKTICFKDATFSRQKKNYTLEIQWTSGAVQCARAFHQNALKHNWSYFKLLLNKPRQAQCYVGNILNIVLLSVMNVFC